MPDHVYCIECLVVVIEEKIDTPVPLPPEDRRLEDLWREPEAGE